MWTGHHCVMALYWTPDKRQKGFFRCPRIMWDNKNGETGGRIGSWNQARTCAVDRAVWEKGGMWGPYVQQSAKRQGQVIVRNHTIV